MPVCVLFVSSRSGIVFNPSAGATTDHSQSAKDMDPHFKCQLYVEDPTTESRYSFTVWVEQTRRASAQQKFELLSCPWVGFEPTTS